MNHKIAILTFHRASNYGAVLQGYALCKAIEKLGGVPEIIDYWPEKFKMVYSYEYPFETSIDYIKSVVKRVILRPVLKTKNLGFEEFVQSYLPLSDSAYFTVEEIENANLKYSLYISGSDQVWNDKCSDFDRIFYLDFPSAQRKYSYAASFGTDVIPATLVSEYRRRLQGYQYYSVREESGKTLLKDILGVDAWVHCDPTLLLDREEWQKIGAGVNRKAPYILLYYVEETQKIQEYAARLARLTGCDVICTVSNTSWRVLSGKADKRFNIECRYTASPSEFVSLMENAEYVITNSFHGTVFSIVFQKKFLVETVHQNGKKNNRAFNLLSQLGLMDRRIEGSKAEDIFEEIDWKAVGKKLDVLRNQSFSYLEQIIREIE